MNFKARELRFNLKDKSQFNAEEVKKALTDQGFANVEIKSGPTPKGP